MFLTSKAKKLFQRLKQIFCKKYVLQHFDIYKPIRVGIDISKKTIWNILFQKNSNKN